MSPVQSSKIKINSAPRLRQFAAPERPESSGTSCRTPHAQGRPAAPCARSGSAPEQSANGAHTKKAAHLECDQIPQDVAPTATYGSLFGALDLLLRQNRSGRPPSLMALLAVKRARRTQRLRIRASCETHESGPFSHSNTGMRRAVQIHRADSPPAHALAESVWPTPVALPSGALRHGAGACAPKRLAAGLCDGQRWKPSCPICGRAREVVSSAAHDTRRGSKQIHIDQTPHRAPTFAHF